MGLKFYLYGILFTTLTALASAFFITYYFPPEAADLFMLSLLFLSLFIGLTGGFSLINFLVRRKKFSRRELPVFFNVSFRQGLLLSLLLTGTLAMRAYMDLWWVGSVMLLLTIMGVEMIFQKNRR